MTDLLPRHDQAHSYAEKAKHWKGYPWGDPGNLARCYLDLLDPVEKDELRELVWAIDPHAFEGGRDPKMMKRRAKAELIAVRILGRGYHRKKK